MGIEDIQISEELETNAPSIKYSGNEGPKSPQQMEQMMMAQLEEEYLKYVDDMMEQGMEPMTLEQFLDQTMAEGQMSSAQPMAPQGMPARQMAAYGGIMGMDGRKQYGIGSFFQEKIMDPLKKNPLVTAALAAAGVDLFGRENSSNSVIRKVLGSPTFETILKGKEVLGKDKKPTGERKGGLYDAISSNIVPIVGGTVAGLFTDSQGGGKDASTYGVPSDNTALQLADLKKSANILDQKQGLAANLNFLPTVESRKYTPTEMVETYAQAANGGRIGFENAGPVVDEQTTQMILDMNNRGMDVETISTITQQNANTVNAILSAQNQKAEGGIMDLGGMEKDYRAEGGFVPIGRKEKADDVPARLSVNEFVFTADAVRNAGGGDIDQGAQVMENMMKNLEAGGQVSEESQGMQGARDMFATSERLSEVI